MLISTIAYQVFYNQLREKFIEKTLNGRLPDRCNKYSAKIWNEINPATKQAFAFELFQGIDTTNPQYFYRKSLDFKPEKLAEGEIDYLAFSKALKYLDIKPSDDKSEFEKLSLPDQANVLYWQFLEVNKQEIQDYAEKAQKKPPLRSQGHADTNSAISDSNLTAAKFCVQRFYEYIGSSNLQQAWDLLAPDFQNKLPWKGDFEKFRIGFTNTNGIRNIVVFDLKQTIPNNIDCRVFYEDELNAHTTKELSSLESMTVGELDDFIQNIKILKENFESKGLQGFDDIEIRKLFEPSAAEYIWYRCNFDHNKLSELFNRHRAIVIKRLYDCSCRYVNGNWLINQIHSIKFVSAR